MIIDTDNLDEVIKEINENCLKESDPIDYNDYILIKGVLNSFPVKPIDYSDCANAMMKMWMDNVVTDGEYNRIMDKLNKKWGKI